MQHTKGRGKVDVSMRYSQFYMAIVRKWFNQLRWRPRSEGPNAPNNTVTLLECVVHLELATGHCLGTTKGEDLTWPQNARRLVFNLRALARTHTIAWNGIGVTYRQALRPTTGATSITPLGGTTHVGLCQKAKMGRREDPRGVSAKCVAFQTIVHQPSGEKQTNRKEIQEVCP